MAKSEEESRTLMIATILLGVGLVGLAISLNDFDDSVGWQLFAVCNSCLLTCVLKHVFNVKLPWNMFASRRSLFKITSICIVAYAVCGALITSAIK